MSRETVGHTFLVALLLCVVCSLAVSSAAVVLKPFQEVNKKQDFRRNILSVAGLTSKDGDILAPPEDISADPEVTKKKLGKDVKIDEFFPTEMSSDAGVEIGGSKWVLESKVVDLETGEYLDWTPQQITDFDPFRDAKDPDKGVKIEGNALEGFKERAKAAVIYHVLKDGELFEIIFPIYGKGLWSTLKGFMAVGDDMETIRGITYYEHGETPGLGGEVDNIRWKESWEGKQVYGPDDDVQIQVIKGSVGAGTPDPQFKVDGLSGATITSRGVTTMLRYWFGPEGFGPYIEKIKSGEKIGEESVAAAE